LRRSTNDLPSRVADNMFWLGRQIERAEGLVRQARAVISRLVMESEPGNMPELPVLLEAMLDGHASASAAAPASVAGAEAYRQRQAEILRLLYDEKRSDSLRSTVKAVHRLAVLVRDRLSTDSFRILNQLERELAGAAIDAPLGDALLQLNQLIVLLAAFSGMGTESMTRGPGWRFLDMGRRIERAIHTVGLLERTLVRPSADGTPVIEALLEIADSSMTYRSRYLMSVQLPAALDLILFDESNPRSVAFQLEALARHVKELPRDEGKPQMTPEQRVMQAVQTELVLTDVESLCAAVDPDDGRRKELEELFSRLETQLGLLSQAIANAYLVHSGPSRHLGRMIVPTLP
jgi:uncharacterized alpha-E superfamily protein